ncbi:MAG: phosphate ABC transporter substrate-binding protein [Betaproteobacteria bacterium]
MKRAILIAASLLFAGAADADVYLISHPGLQLTPEEAADVFTGEKQLAGSVKLAPMDNAALQEEFLAKALHMNGAKYSTLWAKKAFRDGLNAPPVRGNDLEVLRIVRSTPGAVGYVSAPAPGVNVIRKY